jgi:hypothetical protein
VSLRFYLDEDSAEQALVQALRSRGVEVLVPHEVGLHGADDLVQLRWCAEREYVLISHNASDFCRHHREFLTCGETHAGLIVVQQQTLSVGGRLRGLIKLAAARSPEAMRNHIAFLSAWT